MRSIIIATALIFLLFSSTWAYLEPSFRIKALGEDFAGIIVDEYTDIFRNPAYLTLVKNYKILSEYRKDGFGKGEIANRLILGAILPKFSFGKFAILGKGWQQKSENLYQIETFYAQSNTTIRNGRTSENINNPTLKSSDLIYALSLGHNFNLGANFIYFEDQTKSSYRSNEFVRESDNTSGLLVRESIRISSNNYFRTNKFIQFTSGVKFPWKQTLNLDLILTFQHLNPENTNNSWRISQTNYYDSLGNISQTSENIDTSEFVTPSQKGNNFGIGFRVSKSLTSLERVNLLWGFSYTNWETKAERNEVFYQNDTLRSSIQQFFKGDKKDIKIQLKLGVESKKSDNKIKVYAGITNFLAWEKQTYPDFLPSKPKSKFRNSFFKISLPLGVEYHPLNKLTLRYGALPSYTYNRTEGFIPYFTWNTSTTRTTSFNNSFGYSFQPLKNLIIEGYILQFGNLFSINDWIFGASYNF